MKCPWFHAREVEIEMEVEMEGCGEDGDGSRVESEYKEERGMQPIKSKEGGKNKFKNLIANAD